MGEARLRRARLAANPPPPLEPATCMASTIERLTSIEAFLIAPDHVLAYGRYLATVLGPELTPMGFLVRAEIARDQLRRDYHGPDEVRVPREFRPLVLGNESLYWVLNQYVPKIVEAACPWDFAEEAVRLYHQHPSPIAAAIDGLRGGLPS